MSVHQLIQNGLPQMYPTTLLPPKNLLLVVFLAKCPEARISQAMHLTGNVWSSAVVAMAGEKERGATVPQVDALEEITTFS